MEFRARKEKRRGSEKKTRENKRKQEKTRENKKKTRGKHIRMWSIGRMFVL